MQLLIQRLDSAIAGLSLKQTRNYQMISSYDYQLISSYAERTWSKRVVLPTLYLQSHLGLQMTGALKYKESELPSQPLQKPGAKTDLAELIQMVWFGYIWLVSN